MKKFISVAFCSLVLFTTLFSQKKSVEEKINRCGTMIRVERMFKDNPALKTFSQQPTFISPGSKKINNYRTNAIVTIPVVVHIVLNNPNIVTEADVQWQIDKLNLDYSGLNPDSINEPAAFIAVRGHSQIRFALARRTPTGSITNGIERIISSVGSNANLSVDPVKRASQGGADVWDPNQYLNFWVSNDASGQGILGYAQFPGSSISADDGVFINVRSWGNNPCYVISQYSLGRTAVHEVGHYFGLLHNWGDEDACTGDDFKSLTSVGSSCNLPAGLFNPTGQGNTALDIGDTPNQAASSSGLCPSGTKTDACTSIAPGVMYQDYMDYTDDACYSMFTKKQVERMEWVLDNCRSSLKTSLGATVIAGTPLIDASPYQSVNPGGAEVVACSSVLYPSTLPCPGTFIPKIRIRNNGLTTLNSVTVGLLINGVAQAPINVSQSMPFGYTTVVSFPLMNVTTGTYTFKFFTSKPNGIQPDDVPSNDTLTTTLTVATPLALPVVEGFENSGFPPAGWSLYNPNSDFTWVKVTPGHNSNFSAAIDNYNNDAQGKIDDIRTPRINLSPADSVLIISFDVAHKNYPDSTNYDTLSVLVSNDCGATFTSVYKKYGPNLATDTSSLAFITPAQADWKREKITIRGSLLSAGNIIVAFRNTNRFGNNIFLDNINIAPPSPGDIRLVSINDPAGVICSTPVSPAITIQNTGSDIVSNLNLSYSIDNGPVSVNSLTALNLLPAQQINVTLTPPFIIAGVGAHVIKVYVSNVSTVNGATDQNSSNDTLTKTFTIAGKTIAPLVQGFDSTLFPPLNWALDNPDGSITWQRTTAAAKTGVASMVIRNYDYPSINNVDAIVTPVISGISNYDSLFVSFDMAYSPPNTNTTGPYDTLEILATNDCGKTFTSVWKKWGVDLQTTTGASANRFIPTASDWKNIRVLLTQFINKAGVQLYFVAKSNNQNNLYIDNINVFGIILPQVLKDKGYELYPNPFSSSLLIHHLFPPTDLQSVQVYNSVGQIVWQNQLDGKGSGQMIVDLSKTSSGLYFVKLNYTTRTIVEKIIKR